MFQHSHGLIQAYWCNSWTWYICMVLTLLGDCKGPWGCGSKEKTQEGNHLPSKQIRGNVSCVCWECLFRVWKLLWLFQGVIQREKGLDVGSSTARGRFQFFRTPWPERGPEPLLRGGLWAERSFWGLEAAVPRGVAASRCRLGRSEVVMLANVYLGVVSFFRVPSSSVVLLRKAKRRTAI